MTTILKVFSGLSPFISFHQAPKPTQTQKQSGGGRTEIRPLPASDRAPVPPRLEVSRRSGTTGSEQIFPTISGHLPLGNISLSAAGFVHKAGDAIAYGCKYVLTFFKELNKTDNPETTSPVGSGKSFFRTRQGLNRTCAKHALNAFLGSNTATLADLNRARDAIRQHEREHIPYLAGGTRWQGRFFGFMQSTVQHLLRKSGMETDCHGIALLNNPDFSPRRHLGEKANDFLKDFAEAHGKSVDEVRNDRELRSEAAGQFATQHVNNELRDLQDKLKDQDRCMIVSGTEKSSHWVAFRKDESGRWRLLDSQRPIGDQPVLDPCTYLKQRWMDGKTLAEVVIQHSFRQPSPEQLSGWLNAIRCAGWPDIDNMKFKDVQDIAQKLQASNNPKAEISEDELNLLQKYYQEFRKVYLVQGDINLLGDAIQALGGKVSTTG